MNKANASVTRDRKKDRSESAMTSCKNFWSDKKWSYTNLKMQNHLIRELPENKVEEYPVRNGWYAIN